MKDKRKTKRRYLLYYMRLYDSKTLQQIGNLVDITRRGAMIVGEHPIPEGQISRLRLELTYEVAEKPYMEFTVCSKWCKPDITPYLYNIGFEITDMAPEDIEIIERINEAFGFRENTPVELESRPSK